MKPKIVTLTLAALLMTGSGPAEARPSIDTFCTGVAKLAATAVKWRDAGTPYLDAVRNFNYGWRRAATAANGWNSQDAKIAKRVYDVAIFDAYQPPLLGADAQRDLEYGHCVAYFKGENSGGGTPTSRDNPDSDLQTPDPDEDQPPAAAPTPEPDGTL